MQKHVRGHPCPFAKPHFGTDRSQTAAATPHTCGHASRRKKANPTARRDRCARPPCHPDHAACGRPRCSRRCARTLICEREIMGMESVRGEAKGSNVGSTAGCTPCQSTTRFSSSPPGFDARVAAPEGQHHHCILVAILRFHPACARSEAYQGFAPLGQGL